MAMNIMLECPECDNEYNLNYSEEPERWDCPSSCEFDSCPFCGYRLDNDQLTDVVDNWKTYQYEIGVD